MNGLFASKLAPTEGLRHHFFVKPEPPYPEIERRALLLLNPAQQARVERNRAMVHEHMPELVQIFQEWHELGMIDGWRSIGEVILHREVDHGTA